MACCVICREDNDYEVNLLIIRMLATLTDLSSAVNDALSNLPKRTKLLISAV